MYMLIQSEGKHWWPNEVAWKEKENIYQRNCNRFQ